MKVKTMKKSVATMLISVFTVVLINLLTVVSINGQEIIIGDDSIVNIPDENLKTILLDKYDADVKDGEIEVSEAEAATGLLEIKNANINDITGLEAFKNLTELNLTDNGILDITPLSNLTNIKNLNLSNNQIVDISSLENLINLTDLNLNFNKIVDISILSNLTNIKNLNLSNNQIVDISSLSSIFSLDFLNISNNQISDISPLSTLKIDYKALNNNVVLDDITISKEKEIFGEVIDMSGDIKQVSLGKAYVGPNTLSGTFEELYGAEGEYGYSVTITQNVIVDIGVPLIKTCGDYSSSNINKDNNIVVYYKKQSNGNKCKVTYFGKTDKIKLKEINHYNSNNKRDTRKRYYYKNDSKNTLERGEGTNYQADGKKITDYAQYFYKPGYKSYYQRNNKIYDKNMKKTKFKQYVYDKNHNLKMRNMYYFNIKGERTYSERTNYSSKGKITAYATYEYNSLGTIYLRNIKTYYPNQNSKTYTKTYYNTRTHKATSMTKYYYNEQGYYIHKVVFKY